MEARIVFPSSLHLAAPPRADRRADRESCVRRSPLLAAVPLRSREPRPCQPRAAGATGAPPKGVRFAARVRIELLREVPIRLQLSAAGQRRIRAATTFFGRQLGAAGSRPAAGAALFRTSSFWSTGRRVFPGTEGATRAHVDFLTTLVSTSPRRFIAECAALCPRATSNRSDTLSPDFSPNSWLVTILSSSTSISQKPASH
jgi:hypothetical protein